MCVHSLSSWLVILNAMEFFLLLAWLGDARSIPWSTFGMQLIWNTHRQNSGKSVLERDLVTKFDNFGTFLGLLATKN